MSAIAGIFGKTVNKDQLQNMIDRMQYRGPDRAETRTLKNGGVGVAELSLSSRSTAAISGTELPLVLFDGDIFNDIAAGMSNVDFIREQYNKNGKACFSQLDGSFSCAVIDKDEILLVRDHVGSRPLIYNDQDGVLAFASEAKALLDFTNVVEELPPGMMYSTRDGLHDFTGYSPQLLNFETSEQAAEILETFLFKAVEKRMADGAVKAVALSGGLDSSIIASVAKSIDPTIKLFSTTIKRSPSQDIKYAKIMAEYLGLDHEIYEITDQEIKDLIPEAVWFMETFDEDCISGAVANYFTSKCVAGYTNCVLVGEGADELFGGYFKELKDISDPEEKERVARKLVDIAYNTALRRLDRSWLANSVHYRTPFLDPAVVALSDRISLDLKVKYDQEQQRNVEKWILRKAMRKWLPDEILNRPKLRFAGGTGVDDIMAELTADKVSEKEFKQNPKTGRGLELNSPKELYYYRLFRDRFPDGYESMVARWDPFK